MGATAIPVKPTRKYFRRLQARHSTKFIFIGWNTRNQEDLAVARCVTNHRLWQVCEAAHRLKPVDGILGRQ
jgi:hypothetical protein